MSERRVALVTGGSGFIGRWVTASLRARGYEVAAPSSREADLLEPSTAARLVETLRPTHLVHLAWYAEPGKFWTSPENERWVEASLRLVHAFAGAGGTRVVAAGTCAEYRWTDETHCVEGQTPLDPATAYGAAKDALRRAAEAELAHAGVSFAWGRIFFVYGPGEDPRRLAGSVVASLLRGEPAETSHGEQVRDFLSTIDLGDAFAALADSSVEGALNVASGAPIRLRELVEALGRAVGREDLLRIGARPAAAGEPASLTADVARLRDEVGWSSRLSLDEGAAAMVAAAQAR